MLFADDLAARRDLDPAFVRNAIGHAPVVLPPKPWSHLSDHAPLAAEIEI